MSAEALLKEFRKTQMSLVERLEVITRQQLVLIDLLQRKVDLDVAEQEIMALLKRRLQEE